MALYLCNFSRVSREQGIAGQERVMAWGVDGKWRLSSACLPASSSFYCHRSFLNSLACTGFCDPDQKH
jgi:hypothetical protein